jgi:hypothetical protein
MPDTDFSFKPTRKLLFQGLYPDYILVYLQVTARHGNATGIVTAVLQSSQAVEQNRPGLSFPYIANDAAHIA